MLMMERARTQPNYKILNRIIQVVKQAFTDKTDQGEDDETGKKGEEKKQKQQKKPAAQVFAQALNSEEYLKLLQFFGGELPGLCLKLAGVKAFGKIVDLKKSYSGLSSKMSILLKSYSANFTRLLSDALLEDNLSHIGNFFIRGQDVVQCVLPFNTYVKKLANVCARITAMYSRIESSSIILAFNALRSLIYSS